MRRIALRGWDGWRAPVASRALPWLLLAVGVAGEAAVLLVQDRRLWFFRDDFAFLLGRHLSEHPVSALMTPHSVHWSALPVLAFRAMWSVFGLRQYLPYAVLPLLLHLAVAVCLVVLARRAGAGPWSAVLSGLVFAYLGGGAGAENPLWAFQIGFIGSCLGGVAALILLDLSATRGEGRWGGRCFWTGQLCLVAALMCSGMGVPMVVVAASWALLRRAPFVAMLTALVPGLAFACWYVGWGHSAFDAQPNSVGVVRAGVSAAKAMADIWTAATTVPASGSVVLLALVAAVAVTARRSPLRALGAAALIGLAVEYLVLGLGRSHLDAHLHSRYVYVGLVLCTPAVTCAIELVANRVKRLTMVRAVAWLAVAVLVVAAGSVETARYAAERRAADPAREQELLAAAALIRAGTPLLSERIDPFDDSRDPAMSVSRVESSDALSQLPAGRPSATALFDERAALQVGVRSTSMDVPDAATYRMSGRTAPPGGACTTRATASAVTRLQIPLGEHGAEVEIDLLDEDGTGRAVRTWIEQNGVTSMRSSWPLDSAWGLTGRRLFVASTMADATLEVALPAGDVQVCPSVADAPRRRA
jgi:hypothetical protein